MVRKFRRHRDVDLAAGAASRSPTMGTSVNADGLLEEQVSDESALSRHFARRWGHLAYQDSAAERPI